MKGMYSVKNFKGNYQKRFATWQSVFGIGAKVL